ncbi:MAG: Ig-like domain-containing protein, partial [Verrucomicrobiota bacterium]|nr:Ig-like domain-containing protein [Verrucomicrobiota bacterium]
KDKLSINETANLIAFTRRYVDNNIKYNSVFLKNMEDADNYLIDSWSGEDITSIYHLPTLSSNGDALIYKKFEDGKYTVCWCPIDNSVPLLSSIKSIEAETNQSISISGDGSKVVFDTAGTSAKDIILWEPETDSQTTIASNVTGYPVISGNGNCIAYFNGNDIIAHFASADGLFADSTKLFSITDSDGNLSDISISMNGQFASYHSGTKLKILDLTSGTITTIQEESVRADLSVNNSQLSPGAGYIYLTTSSDDAYRYDINGASYLSNSLGSESYAGVLSPDGTKVCFASNAQLADDTDDHRDVFIVDFANSVANEKPISASVDLGTYDLDEDSLTPIEIVLSASDDHDNDLTYMIASQPIHGTVAFQYADGLPWLIYNVTELNFNGTDSFTFRAVDSSGLHSEEATINITITPVNDPPEFTLGSDIVVDEDFQGTETVSSTPGSIPDDETEQVVNYSLSPSSVDFATVNIDPVTGEISVVTVADGNGTQLFTVTANDAQQENNTYQQNFLLTINPVDEEIPRETNTLNSQTLIEGESFAPFDLDNYFEDVDGNDLDFSRSGIVNLIIDIDNNNIVSVSAPEGWVGSEEITFTATDKTDQEKYTSETILFKINVQRTFDLKEGWNLISFPLEIDTVRNSDIFDKNTGTIWFWEEGEYKTVESLLDIVSGYGYWYYSKTEQNLDFEGQFPDSASIPLEDGWNMIGPIGTGNDMNIPERFRNNFIWFWDATETVYKNIAYGNLDKFESKKGYWLNNINNEVAIELELLE